MSTAAFKFDHCCVSSNADHDFRISRDDLLRYGNHSLTYRIVDRIFAQVTACYVEFAGLLCVAQWSAPRIVDRIFAQVNAYYTWYRAQSDLASC